MDISFEKPTIFGVMLRFVVIVRKQTRGENAPMCRIAVNDSSVLGSRLTLGNSRPKLLSHLIKAFQWQCLFKRPKNKQEYAEVCCIFK